jgi:hypothetical protein
MLLQSRGSNASYSIFVEPSALCIKTIATILETVSMEGLAVEFHLANLLRKYKAGNLDVEELKQQLGFISHFLDVSRQD